MTTSDPIHVAFVWHMHQPYYRSARTGAFQMPWARLHALKDYLDMVEILADYPGIHQTFNLVPSLVEQLEDYAAGMSGGTGSGVSGDPAERVGTRAAGPTARPSSEPGAAEPVVDVYWEHTIKPAAELLPSERIFVVERMCERSDHPRAKSHHRYLELAQKREAAAYQGWEACAAAFSIDELRDLQVWFNLAWFDPTLLEAEPLLSLVNRGRLFREEDKLTVGRVQQDTLARVIPAYKEAARRGQVELSTSPYYHPILPLLCNTDSARVGAGETILPHRRFAHPDDAWEQVERGVAKYERVFGVRPLGMWCSEQAVGEDVLPLLLRAGIEWTIGDETVLSRSLAGSAAPSGAAGKGTTAGNAGDAGASPYTPYLLAREEGTASIVFRDHTLSDLIGFGYQRWDSRDAAHDLLDRVHRIADDLGEASVPGGGSMQASSVATGRRPPLITIALDGENAWEYYPHDGRDFLHYLYEELSVDPAIRCVTVAEHLREYPATEPLDWLHTGSWIGGDLRTWSGDPGHNTAWDLLHDARDLAASRRRVAAEYTDRKAPGDDPAETDPAGAETAAARAAEAADAAWEHVLVAEGSDWFWWFGEHHHTELDHVWDAEFRQRLQEVYRRLGEPAPIRLYLPILSEVPSVPAALPHGLIDPHIDGRFTAEDGWEAAGLLPPDHPSTMQRAGGARIIEVRFGWGPEHLFLLLIPRDVSDLPGLELELRLTMITGAKESAFLMKLEEPDRIDVASSPGGHLAGAPTGAWRDVVEIAVPVARAPLGADGQQDVQTEETGDKRFGLVLRVGREGMTDHVFRSTGVTAIGEEAP